MTMMAMTTDRDRSRNQAISEAIRDRRGAGVGSVTLLIGRPGAFSLQHDARGAEKAPFR